MICPYCFRSQVDNKVLFTNEHVLQEALGGKKKIRICYDCNHSFSDTIDQSFNELFAIKYRFYLDNDKEKKVRRSSIPHPEKDIDLSVDVVNLYENYDRRTAVVYIKPQILIEQNEGGNFNLEVINPAKLFKVFDKLLANNNLNKIKVYILKDNSSIRSVKSSGKILFKLELDKDRYLLLKGNDESVKEKIIPMLVKNMDLIKNAELKPMPFEDGSKTLLTIRGNFKINEVCRAAGKIVYNYLAYFLKEAFVQRKEFDNFRKYIKGIDIQNNGVLPAEFMNTFVNQALDRNWNDLIDFNRKQVLDSRFVVPALEPALIRTYNLGLSYRVKCESFEHSIIIYLSGDELCAILTILGNSHFMIKIGKVRDFREIVITDVVNINNSHDNSNKVIQKGFHLFTP